MFWGCVSYYAVDTLVPIDVNIAAQHILTFETRIYAGCVETFGGKPCFFQDNNAPVHHSLHTCQWKTGQGISSISCLHSSWMSTLSKTFWEVIKRCVQKDISIVKTRGDLIACVLE